MNEVLALTLQAMQTGMQRLDRISSNVANAQTPGYKRDITAVGPTQVPAGAFQNAMARAASAAAPADVATEAGAGTPVSRLQIHTDTRAGSLRATGQSLDLALAGPGFFEIRTAQGLAYTRQGNFHVDARGRLVNAQGDAVQGSGGDIVLPAADAVIDSQGTLRESGASPDALASAPGAMARVLGQLRVVQFDDPSAIQRLGDGLLAANGGVSQMKDADIQVRQGYLENANVNTLQEMVQLMQTMRHFETMQKVALGYDEMTGQAVRKLGELA